MVRFHSKGYLTSNNVSFSEDTIFYTTFLNNCNFSLGWDGRRKLYHSRIHDLWNTSGKSKKIIFSTVEFVKLKNCMFFKVCFWIYLRKKMQIVAICAYSLMFIVGLPSNAVLLYFLYTAKVVVLKMMVIS